MTQEEKELLFKVLGEQLQYGVNVSVSGAEFDSYQYPYLLTAISKFGSECLCKVYSSIYTPFGCPKVEDVKPYLRPMSSMTEEEVIEYLSVCDKDYKDSLTTPRHSGADWLNTHHFDYRGLIEMGLALEATEDMYKIE